MDNVTKHAELEQMIESIQEIKDQRMWDYLIPDVQAMILAFEEHIQALQKITPLVNNSTGYTQEAITHMKR